MAAWLCLPSWRFSALGVFFFCAFMFSTMSSMAMDAVQALFTSDEEGGLSMAPELRPSELALRHLFDEKRRLRWVYRPAEIEAMIAHYGRRHHPSHHPSSGSFEEEEEEFTLVSLSTVLLSICVLVKVLLFTFCRRVQRRTGSEIVDALALDHRNDTLSNSTVIFTMVLVGLVQGSAWDGDWLAKVDPLVSLLLSLWIIHGWISNALDQFKVLSDQRSDETDLEAINEAVQSTLKGTPLEFMGSDVYNIGDGVLARLELQPAPGAVGCERVAACVEALDVAVRAANSDVRQIDVHVRPRSAEAASKESFSWVQEYKS